MEVCFRLYEVLGKVSALGFHDHRFSLVAGDDLDPIDISSYLGLIAVGLLTLNILLGILQSIHYNTVKRWPHKKINIYKIHNWTGYAALCVALLHPFSLLLSKSAGFRLLDILYPINSPKQPTENTIGGIALYLLIVVVVTSYFRRNLGNKVWKKLHYISYASAAAFFTHGILTDPNLKNTPLDPFDAEKLFIELCALAVVLATTWRIRYAYTGGAKKVVR